VALLAASTYTGLHYFFPTSLNITVQHPAQMKAGLSKPAAPLMTPGGLLIHGI
jgi:hypothetical protein